jgi:hypothetical protein
MQNEPFLGFFGPAEGSKMACSGNVFTVHRRPKNLRNFLLFLLFLLLLPPLRFLRDFMPPHILTACGILVVMFASLLPLMMARTASFPKAGQFCAEQKAQIDPAAEPTLDDSLYPVHLGNCLSMFACTCLNLVVLYRSPHLTSSSDQARTLDKKCASLLSTFSVVIPQFSLFKLFCPSVSALAFVHFCAAILVTLATVQNACTTSKKSQNTFGTLIVGLRFFFFIWNKNMAVHSYLYRRAKIIQIDM